MSLLQIGSSNKLECDLILFQHIIWKIILKIELNQNSLKTQTYQLIVICYEVEYRIIKVQDWWPIFLKITTVFLIFTQEEGLEHTEKSFT